MNNTVLENTESDLEEQERKVIKKVTTTKLPQQKTNFTYLIHALYLRQTIPVNEFVAFLSACGIERENEVWLLTTFIYIEDGIVHYLDKEERDSRELNVTTPGEQQKAFSEIMDQLRKKYSDTEDVDFLEFEQ